MQIRTSMSNKFDIKEALNMINYLAYVVSGLKNTVCIKLGI
jgi:hypothetical protein